VTHPSACTTGETSSSRPRQYCRSNAYPAGSSGNSSTIGRIRGIPVSDASHAWLSRYGTSRLRKRAYSRKMPSASSPNSQGSRGVAPWYRLNAERKPHWAHRT
jgi:hypothetical protein